MTEQEGVAKGESRTRGHLSLEATEAERAQYMWDSEMEARARKHLAQYARRGSTNGNAWSSAWVRTGEGGTWLRLQLGTDYNWSMCELKVSKRVLQTDLEKIIDAQVAVFEMTGGLR